MSEVIWKKLPNEGGYEMWFAFIGECKASVRRMIYPQRIPSDAFYKWDVDANGVLGVWSSRGEHTTLLGAQKAAEDYVNHAISHITVEFSREGASELLRYMMSTVHQYMCQHLTDEYARELIPYACREIMAGNRPSSSSGQNLDENWARNMSALADALGYWVDRRGDNYTPRCDQGR